ncbi:MAG: NAD(P)/FAD-dependent oxidoreductase [Thaumarchaeota archaeon]|nr:NAD(P)/FAD-dependent oxidoreductase [Nitrososphaerota archaeon]
MKKSGKNNIDVSDQKRILVIGGGFAGIEVLRRLEKKFENDFTIDVSMVSKNNFLLFTPMLPEVASGMIETRHIVTPIRAFCKRARFYEATVSSIDFQKRQAVISSVTGNRNGSVNYHDHTLDYDYLVVSLGGETNFFGMDDVRKCSYTMKSLGDAIILRNHVIDMLEQASMEQDSESRQGLMTFVVVGGGFAGIETVGELNALVRDAVRDFYHDIDVKDIRMVLVDAGGKILPEVTDDLSKFATQKLKESGIDIILQNPVSSATQYDVKLKDGTVIVTHTLVWAGGVTPEKIVKELQCEHDKSGRIVVDRYLEVKGIAGVYALGDCASITDTHTGRPYPPTAQNAVEEAKVVANNLISAIRGGNKISFNYKSRGIMAQIGKRKGVGILFGIKTHGLLAWMIWRSYYLSSLPTLEKKLRVLTDWTIDMFFKPDITRLNIFTENQEIQAKALSDTENLASKHEAKSDTT